ncbi:hypothetical protein BC629DRAFT_1438625 [Irpex lacteus]|nr:hypothetical protein BC629DRAFT_1438625 [Irpex lacteus]
MTELGGMGQHYYLSYGCFTKRRGAQECFFVWSTNYPSISPHFTSNWMAIIVVPTVPAPALNLPTPSNCVIAARSIPGGAPVPVLVLPDDENNTVLFPLTLFDSHRRFLYYGVIVYVDHEYKDLDLNSGSGVATPVNTLLDKKGAMHRQCWPPENGGHTKTEVYDKYST